MEKRKSRTDREIPTFPQPIAWLFEQEERRRTDRMNRPRVVYFPSGVLVYFPSGATSQLTVKQELALPPVRLAVKSRLAADLSAILDEGSRAPGVG
jgi:hypothetical protein